MTAPDSGLGKLGEGNVEVGEAARKDSRIIAESSEEGIPGLKGMGALQMRRVGHVSVIDWEAWTMITYTFFSTLHCSEAKKAEEKKKKGSDPGIEIDNEYQASSQSKSEPLRGIYCSLALSECFRQKAGE